MQGVPPVGQPNVNSSVLSDGKSIANDSASNPFEQLLQRTDEQQKLSESAIQQLVEGKTDSVQQVVLAVAKAELSFQMFMEIRNKLIESYHDLMRMQF